MRPSHLLIDLENLRHNFFEIKKHVSPAKIMAVVKANAYGHGLVECSKEFEKLGVDYLGVAFLEEAIELRDAGIKTPILTLGGISGRQIEEFLEYDVELLASSISKLNSIEETAKRLGKVANVHLKIDTGMERVGIHHDSKQISDFLTLAYNLDHVKVKGIETHFACSEETNDDFTNTQLTRFLSCLEKHDSKSSLLHSANSGAILSSKNYHLGMVRPGRILYGVTPAPHLNSVLNLKPVMSLKSEIAYFKVVKAGSSVSYGRTWFASKDTRVVTVPLGYGDGYRRALSNTGEVLINGKRYPIIGTICMDQFMVDIGTDSAYNGDIVTLIGQDGSEIIRVEELAEKIQGESLELLTGFNSRLPRVYRDSEAGSA